jgi:hypothetical protein
MLMAHPTVLADLLKQYETLRARHDKEDNAQVRRCLNDVSYTLCVATGTRDIEAALTAARHQLRSTRPEDDSLRAAT